MIIIGTDGELFTVTDAARILDISVQTLRLWDKKGLLKPTLVMNRGVRLYSKNDLEKFLQKKEADENKSREV
jgi:DNA-binding transcriptional MerR regulator